MNVPSKNGFTLWEIVIALTMFALGIVSIINLVPSMSKTGNRASKFTEAAFISKMLMAEMKKDALTLSDTDFVNYEGGKWGAGGPQIVHTPFPVGQRQVLGELKISWTSRLADLGNMYKAQILIYSLEQGQNYVQEFITYVPKD